MLALTEKVRRILKNYPETRNSDIELTIRLWWVFHRDKINSDGTVKIRELWNLPREDNIKRIRAKIQNDQGMFLPTDPQIIKERQKLSKKWKQDLGYDPTQRQVAQKTIQRVERDTDKAISWLKD